MQLVGGGGDGGLEGALGRAELERDLLAVRRRVGGERVGDMCVSATSIDFVFVSTYLLTFSNSASMRPRNLTTGLCEDVGFVVVSLDVSWTPRLTSKLAAPPSSISYSRSLSAW